MSISIRATAWVVSLRCCQRRTKKYESRLRAIVDTILMDAGVGDGEEALSVLREGPHAQEPRPDQTTPERANAA